MEKEETKVLGFRVKKEHVASVNEMVRNFLRSKNYKLYEKRKNKKSKNRLQKTLARNARV